MIHVRTLREEEDFPAHLETGFENMPVMKSFCWVAEHDGRIIGILMAAPCHGLVFLVRVKIKDKAPIATASLLFRKCVRDCNERGFKGYLTYIDPQRESERRMIPICRKAGGFQIQDVQVGLVGSFEKAARY